MTYNFNALLDISTNPYHTFENDAVIVKLDTEQITWKSGMYNPKMAKNIRYHLKVRNNNLK